MIYTVLPFDNDIITATMPSDKIFWVMISIAVVMTIISFYSTCYFGRNIRILEDNSQSGGIGSQLHTADELSAR